MTNVFLALIAFTINVILFKWFLIDYYKNGKESKTKSYSFVIFGFLLPMAIVGVLPRLLLNIEPNEIVFIITVLLMVFTDGYLFKRSKRKHKNF